MVLLIAAVGCANGENRQEEIRKKVNAGEYEAAARLAQAYFADDKRTLLVALEYIAVQEKKALKKAYTNLLIIENLNWSTDRPGVTKVSGKLVNTGNKTITGFGIKAACRRDGGVVHEARARWVAEIGPDMNRDFEFIMEGVEGCQDLTATVEDLGLRNHYLNPESKFNPR